MKTFNTKLELLKADLNLGDLVVLLGIEVREDSDPLMGSIRSKNYTTNDVCIMLPNNLKAVMTPIEGLGGTATDPALLLRVSTLETQLIELVELLNSVKETADSAKTRANSAFNIGTSADTKAVDAKTVADSAKATANANKESVATALSNAATAKSAANAADAKAQQALDAIAELVPTEPSTVITKSR